MASAYKCDRCGTLFDPHGVAKSNLYVCCYYHATDEFTPLDLCLKCKAEFLKFMYRRKDGDGE